ncbi:MAG: glycosyltransferase family 39 protein [Planctomycetes bacterium]|nr:glycosyltransferase family 39 protein [Planctomycetota bacterium]
MKAARRWPYVCGLVLLALIPRVGALRRGLSYDELFTLTNFTSKLKEAVGGQLAANNHPLASVLAWLARQVSEGELALRVPFALLGALAAGALCWALWPIGRRRAWLAGGFLALAPPAILASQQVRGYSGAILFGALALGGYIRCSQKGRARDVLTLIFAGGLGLWSHPTIGLGLVALGLATLRYGSGPNAACRRGLAGAFSLGILLWLPILSRTLKFVLKNLFVGPAGGYHPGPLTLSKLATAGGGVPLALGLLGLSLLAGVAFWRRAGAPKGGLEFGAWRQGWAAVSLWALAPIPLLLLSALGYGRFAWFAWPAWAALGAAGCASIRRPVGTLLAALWLGLAGWQVAEQNQVEIHDLRGAMRVAEERSVQLGFATILALGPGSELLPFYGGPLAIELDQAETTLPFFLMEPAVVVIPLPACLDQPLPLPKGAARGSEAPRTLRELLLEAGVVDPIVLPGLESPVLVFSTRGP